MQNHDIPKVALNRGELANACGVSLPTIDKWRRMGMPSIKVGATRRFLVRDVEDWLTRMTTREEDTSNINVDNASED